MHFEPRLWTFTEGVRLRILWAMLIGLIAVGLGVARLGLLGWLIGEVFAGRDLRYARQRDQGQFALSHVRLLICGGRSRAPQLQFALTPVAFTTSAHAFTSRSIAP